MYQKHPVYPGAQLFKINDIVNDSLKFQMAILQIHCFFFFKNCENPLRCKGFSHFIGKN